MKLAFTKMHGLGNDFVVIDATRAPLALSVAQLRHIADRRFGIGCDQILQVEPPREAGTDFYYRIFNADGGEVEQCGNGARCFVRFVHERGLTNKSEIRVGTVSGIIVPRLEADGMVTVDMGAPEFAPARIPFETPQQAPTYALDVGGRTVEINALSMGNPHAVQFVADVAAAPVDSEGPLIEKHARFPRRVNAGFMQVLARDRIALRVFEEARDVPAGRDRRNDAARACGSDRRDGALRDLAARQARGVAAPQDAQDVVLIGAQVGGGLQGRKSFSVGGDKNRSLQAGAYDFAGAQLFELFLNVTTHSQNFFKLSL